MADTVRAGTAEQRAVRVGLAAAAAGFWFVSLGPVIVAASDLHGVTMAFWRSWIAFAVLGLVALARRELSVDLIRPSALAGICFGTSIGLFFWASQITSIASASLITVLQPIPLMIGAYFVFGEQLTRRDIAFAAVAIVGAATLVLAGGSTGNSNPAGDLLAVLSITIGSAYFVFARRSLQTTPLVPFMVGMFGWAGVVLAPVVLLSDEAVLPATEADTARVLAIALLPGVGHVLLNYAQGKAPLNMIGVLQLIIPVNATLMAYWFLDQSVTALQVAGMAVVIAALAIHALSRTRVDSMSDGEPNR